MVTIFSNYVLPSGFRPRPMFLSLLQLLNCKLHALPSHYVYLDYTFTNEILLNIITILILELCLSFHFIRSVINMPQTKTKTYFIRLSQDSRNTVSVNLCNFHPLVAGYFYAKDEALSVPYGD